MKGCEGGVGWGDARRRRLSSAIKYRKNTRSTTHLEGRHDGLRHVRGLSISLSLSLLAPCPLPLADTPACRRRPAAG